MQPAVYSGLLKTIENDRENTITAMTPNLSKELNKILMEMVRTLVSVMEHKDPFLKGHAERVANISMAFVKSLDLPESSGLDSIYFAGLLHDIGMVYMANGHVGNNGKSTPEERVYMRKHPEIGVDILSNLTMIRQILPMIRHHHETVNGRGYPDGLKGEEIPLGARILHLVDSYDLMLRPGDNGRQLTPDQALQKIQKGAGKQYDGNLVEPFITFLKSNKALAAGGGTEVPEAEKEQSPQEVILGIIERFKSGDIELPVLPNIVYEIERVTKNPRSTMDDLAKIIEKDAVISVRLISVANSAIFRGREQIRTLKQAIPRLGISETRNVVTAIASRGLYETDNAVFREMMEKLWLHSLASAYASKEIAQALTIRESDHYFFLGLIHDIGKVLLFKALSQILGKRKDLEMESIIQSVQKMHCSFGAALMRRWKFETEFVRVASLHEGPEYAETTEPEILAVNLANTMTRHMGFSIVETAAPLTDLQSTALLALDDAALAGIQARVTELMAEAAALF